MSERCEDDRIAKPSQNFARSHEAASYVKAHVFRIINIAQVPVIERERKSFHLKLQAGNSNESNVDDEFEFHKSAAQPTNVKLCNRFAADGCCWCCCSCCVNLSKLLVRLFMLAARVKLWISKQVVGGSSVQGK